MLIQTSLSPPEKPLRRRPPPQGRDTESKGAGSLRDKFGTAVDAGFVMFPAVLLRAQHLLGLEAVDLAIILNILMHWWDADDLPYPRPSIIAKRIGVTTRTVERRINKLEEMDLLERRRSEKLKGKLTVRRFDLSGLVKRLEVLSAGNLANRPNNTEVRG